MTPVYQLPEPPPCPHCGYPEQRLVGEPSDDSSRAWAAECPHCGTRTPVSQLITTCR